MGTHKHNPQFETVSEMSTLSVSHTQEVRLRDPEILIWKVRCPIPQLKSWYVLVPNYLNYQLLSHLRNLGKENKNSVSITIPYMINISINMKGRRIEKSNIDVDVNINGIFWYFPFFSLDFLF